MKKIVGLTGLKGSGKDEVANIISRNYGHVRVAFADPLKDVIKTIFGVTEEELTDRVKKEKVLDRWPYCSPRQLLQFIGTDMFRAYYPGVWVKAWQNRVMSIDAPVVASDVRFVDEADLIRSMGGLIIRVVRPGTKNDGHISELSQEAIPADHVIMNDGTLYDLELTVKAALGGYV